MTKLAVATATLVCCLLVRSAFGQTTNATLGGTVSDATGALIPGVNVTATNTQTGIISTALTNESGAYQFASIQPGTYKITAELQGFQTQVSQIDLAVSQVVRLNFTLQVASVGTSVEVNVAADSVLATTSSSMGTVLPESKLSALPLASRNAFDLIETAGGTQSRGGYLGVFAGNRTSATNVTLNGVVVTDGRNDTGATSVTNVTPDLVEEVRVIVSPADAEMGRGAGQVQLVTRSGTNQFRGSVFWSNHNSALDAGSWQNNMHGLPVDYRNRNQYGGRVDGPIIKNKTFFFFLFEGNRAAQRDFITGPVLTAQARQGIFRYFPGAQSGNAISSNPTVDFFGSPITPRGATGPLSSFSVFSTSTGAARDQNRPGFDPTGYMQALIAKMPLPNDFTVGDGLNTAGIRFARRLHGYDNTTTFLGNGPDVIRDQYNARIDHSFNAKHKLSFAMSYQKDQTATNTTGLAQWPNGYNGVTTRRPQVYSLSVVSVLSPTTVNEFRFGYRNSVLRSYTGWDLSNPKGTYPLPSSNGMRFVPAPVLFTQNLVGQGGGAGSRGNNSPLYSYGDTISIIKGLHAFKGGVEARFISNPGYIIDDPPTVTLGAGGVPVNGIDGTSIPGLIGADQVSARNLLIDLSGSIDRIRETFNISSPTDTTFKNSLQMPQSWRYWHANEFSAFFKDDWKLRPSVTLNLGLRWEYYAVPYDDHGFMVAPVGGSKGLWGISGTGYGDMYQPGHLAGSLTTEEFVGKDSPNPSRQFYNDDWNNFGPAVGLSWSLPWFGKEKTVLRAGYGVSYQHTTELRQINQFIGRAPGISNAVTYTSPNLLSLANINLPVPQNTNTPLRPVPLTERTQTLYAWDSNLRSPYIQNWNFSIQRELAPNLTFDVRYIGSKGTKLYGGVPLNDANIFESGILDAFNTTRAGGSAPLLDRMLNNLNLGLGPVNGATVTGSASLRNNTLTRTFLANGSVGQFANFLNTSTTVTGQGGGLIRNGNLPDNLIVVNPQFASVYLITNVGNSTYHSMQLQVTKRLGQGFTNQTSYTWSKALGEQDLDGNVQYFNPRIRSLNKTLLSFHRTHDIRSYATYSLPFGPNQMFLRSAPGWLSGFVENWQLGGIFSWASGAPLNIVASTSSFTQSALNTAVLVGNFPKNSGNVTKVKNGAVYFAGLQQITDPAINGVTTAQGLNTQFSNKAIVDSQGKLVFVNPSPGTLGNLGLGWVEGPANLRLDANLDKRIRITETKQFELRVDVINVMNHPNFDNPIAPTINGALVPNTIDINDINFGRIQSATGNSSGPSNRQFILNARVNF